MLGLMTSQASRAEVSVPPIGKSPCSSRREAPCRTAPDPSRPGVPTRTRQQPLVLHGGFHFEPHRLRNSLPMPQLSDPLHPVVVDGHDGAGSNPTQNLSHGSRNGRVPPLTAPPTTINLELAQRNSSSRGSDSAQTFLRRMRLAATRESPLSPPSDDWLPEWNKEDHSSCGSRAKDTRRP